MGGKWVNRACCQCNRWIEGRAIKVGKCKNDGNVFWIHPECEGAYRLRYPNYERRLK